MAQAEIIAGYRVHPAASVFPLMEGEDFEELCHSIETRGVLHPIILRGDELIDGRNRLRAVERVRSQQGNIHNLGNVPVRQWDDAWGNVAEWIWDTNGTRRHMSQDALAMVCGLIMPLIAKENEEKQKAHQFKPGVSGNPTGKKKEQARTISSEPARDHKAEDARSTVGKIAEAADVSFHKARQVVATVKAVEAGELPRVVIDEVIAGKKELKEVAPKPPKKEKPKPEPKEEAPPQIRQSDHQGSFLDDFRALCAKWSGKQFDAVRAFLAIWENATKTERQEIKFMLDNEELDS